LIYQDGFSTIECFWVTILLAICSSMLLGFMLHSRFYYQKVLFYSQALDFLHVGAGLCQDPAYLSSWQRGLKALPKGCGKMQYVDHGCRVEIDYFFDKAYHLELYHKLKPAS